MAAPAHETIPRRSNSGIMYMTAFLVDFRTCADFILDPMQPLHLTRSSAGNPDHVTCHLSAQLPSLAHGPNFPKTRNSNHNIPPASSSFGSRAIHQHPHLSTSVTFSITPTRSGNLSQKFDTKLSLWLAARVMETAFQDALWWMTDVIQARLVARLVGRLAATTLVRRRSLTLRRPVCRCVASLSTAIQDGKLRPSWARRETHSST